MPGKPMRLDAPAALSVLQRIDELRADERRKALQSEPRSSRAARHQAADATALMRLIGALQEHVSPADARAFDEATERLDAEGP